MNYSNLPGLSSFKLVAERISRVNQRLPYDSPQSMAIVHQIDHLWKWLIEGLNEVLCDTNLKPVGFFSLLMLYSEANGSMAPVELAQCIGEGRTNTTRICDELEAMMLIRRTTDATDRRRIKLMLTPHGVEQIETQLPRLRERADAALVSLSKAEKSQLERLLTKVLATSEQSSRE